MTYQVVRVFDNVLEITISAEKEWHDAQTDVFIAARVTAKNLLPIPLSEVDIIIDIDDNSGPFDGILDGKPPPAQRRYTLKNLKGGCSDTKTFKYGIDTNRHGYHPVDSFKLYFNVGPKYVVDHQGIDNAQVETSVITIEKK